VCLRWPQVRTDGQCHRRTRRGLAPVAVRIPADGNATAKNKAIVAIANKLAIIISHVLATGKPYADLGADYFDAE
jgi:hypothetical protein